MHTLRTSNGKKAWDPERDVYPTKNLGAQNDTGAQDDIGAHNSAGGSRLTTHRSSPGNFALAAKIIGEQLALMVCFRARMNQKEAS
jgi:hypothetical protein